jgi:NAD(P)-dependent dehydrogenase (short-subunit alcohol dehydrogenase family)
MTSTTRAVVTPDANEAHTLYGQHVVVIGGSSGIGLAVARRALASGATVTIAARTASRLANAAAQLQGIGPSSVRTHVLDVQDATSVQQFFDESLPPRQLFVSAAGFAGGSILRDPVDAARAAFDTRVWGAVEVVRAAATRMQGPDDSIVLTGGISTDRPSAGAWPTALGTAATEQLARLLALELAPLRVNAISPGWTDTPMWDAVLGDGKPDTFAHIRTRIPTGRLATPDDVAQVVTMLMTNRAMNGEIVHVDGGHRLT